MDHIDFFGLDIGTDFLRLLKIDSSQSPWQIETLLISPAPKNAIVKDEIKDSAALGALLSQMLTQANIATKFVAVAIPRSLAIIKTTMIDSRLNADEIESRAWIEASRYFPDLIGNIYLDFAVTRSSFQDSSQAELLLVACRKNQIQPYLDIVHQAGLVVKVVDVNCYALARALSLIPQPPALEIIALLNLNINLSSLIVVQKNNLIHAHDQTYQGLRLLTQTQDYLEKNMSTDLLNDIEYYTIINENLISHLRNTMQFFYSSKPNISIEKLLLSGDLASIPLLASFIQREIGIQTDVANPFVNVTFAPGIDDDALIKQAPSFMQCCGLALSEFSG